MSKSLSRVGLTASLLGTSVLALGCAQTHESDQFPQGIYELTIASEVDACSPSRPVGAMGPVAVLVEGAAIDAPVPDVAASLLASPRVRLTRDAAFHAETNRRVPGCEGAWVHEEWTILDSSRARFDILHHQAWQGLASCIEPDLTMPGAPVADCESNRALRYDLAEPCAAPCSLVLTSITSVECACD